MTTNFCSINITVLVITNVTYYKLVVRCCFCRYICVKHPRYSARWCSLHRAKLTILLVSLLTIIICIPNFVSITVQEQPHNANTTIWLVAFKEFTSTEKAIKSFNFWIQAILVKIIPCTGLTILSFLLIQTMKQAEKRRQNLVTPIKQRQFDCSSERTGILAHQGAEQVAQIRLNNMQHEDCGTGTVQAREHNACGVNSTGRDRKTNRTTRMLLVVVALFLVTEFPQGIINLLSGVLVPQFVEEVYMMLGDVLDILALINNGINFILYCTMSKQFRDTFVDVVFACFASAGNICSLHKHSDIVSV